MRAKGMWVSPTEFVQFGEPSKTLSDQIATRGRSIGRRFLELGASLAICGRRAEVLEEAAETFRAELPGAVVTTHPCDIRDPTAVEAT